MSQFQTFDDRQIQSLRKGGKILRECLEHISQLVEPGISTKALDQEAEKFIQKSGGAPGFKGYKGYPSTLCTSVNEECVHGIPGERLLIEGDIVSLDCGVLLDNLYTDACITVPVGQASPDALKLIQNTDNALAAALRVIQA